jgi:uncharacterized integral membrane protein (TIGR00697 family)
MCGALIWCVYLGRTAIYVFTVGCILVSNCTVTKQVDFFGLTTSLGVFIFSVTYLANDILTEYWGRNEALKLVLSNLAAQVAFMIYATLAIWTPAAPTDEASAAIATLFTITPRITIAAIVSAAGGFVCVWIFSIMKERYRRGWLQLMLRNSVSSVIGNWVNTIVFFVIAFWGVLPDNVLGQIILSAMIAKLTVGVFDSPFLILAGWTKNKNPANRTSEPNWAT